MKSNKGFIHYMTVAWKWLQHDQSWIWRRRNISYN